MKFIFAEKKHQLPQHQRSLEGIDFESDLLRGDEVEEKVEVYERDDLQVTDLELEFLVVVQQNDPENDMEKSQAEGLELQVEQRNDQALQAPFLNIEVVEQEERQEVQNREIEHVCSDLLKGVELQVIDGEEKNEHHVAVEEDFGLSQVEDLHEESEDPPVGDEFGSEELEDDQHVGDEEK